MIGEELFLFGENMTSIVQIENNEPLASTLVIAEGFKVTHQSIVKLIRKYEIEFNSDLGLGLEIRFLKNKRTKR